MSMIRPIRAALILRLILRAPLRQDQPHGSNCFAGLAPTQQGMTCVGVECVGFNAVLSVQEAAVLAVDLIAKTVRFLLGRFGLNQLTANCRRDNLGSLKPKFAESRTKRLLTFSQMRAATFVFRDDSLLLVVGWQRESHVGESRRAKMLYPYSACLPHE